jgi:hypothetical protein
VTTVQVTSQPPHQSPVTDRDPSSSENERNGLGCERRSRKNFPFLPTGGKQRKNETFPFRGSTGGGVASPNLFLLLTVLDFNVLVVGFHDGATPNASSRSVVINVEP